MFDDRDPRSLDSRDRDRDGSDPREAESRDPRDVFARDLDLPRGPEREHVRVHGRDYELRGSEVRTLATIGALRVVPTRDLDDGQGRNADLWHGDLDRLRSAGLVQVVGHLDSEDRSPLVTLTAQGRELLESHRSREGRSGQAFYAGAVRPRERTHDAHLCRAYRRTAERLQSKGARIERVVLDYELKRDYQRFLQERNRDRADSDGRPDRTRDEIREWAYEHQLPSNEDGVQFPDLRIEYEMPDGRREVEDVEVTTPHYRGAHAAAKARAGFTRYRARGSRVGGRSGRGGGRSSDITLAEEILE